MLGDTGHPGCVAAASPASQAAQARHWAAETYGFMLTVSAHVEHAKSFWLAFTFCSLLLLQQTSNSKLLRRQCKAITFSCSLEHTALPSREVIYVYPERSARPCAAEAASKSTAIAFALQVADLTPNIGLHWYFFSEMFAHFRPFWHFVFHAAAAALVVPLALRIPHRPLAAALLQCITNALLKPYPSVGDVAQYLVSSQQHFYVNAAASQLALSSAGAAAAIHPAAGGRRLPHQHTMLCRQTHTGQWTPDLRKWKLVCMRCRRCCHCSRHSWRAAGMLSDHKTLNTLDMFR